MLRKMLPQIKEFCTAVYPIKAVGQGCAIHFATPSKTVLKHDSRNIVTLDPRNN